MANNIFDDVIENLTFDLKLSLSMIPSDIKKNIEEIRLRVNSPLTIYSLGQDFFISKDGIISSNSKNAIVVSFEQINKTFQILCNYSIYALSEELRNGFITIKGGHRVGIGGKIVHSSDGIESIKNISSLNFRIAREKYEISNKLLKYLVYEGKFLNTLIISPPQCGKTTLLRDIIRNLSNGMNDPYIKGYKVGLVDERSEIAGVFNGIPQKDVGIRTDILDSCLKSLGIIILIRSMSPEIIAVDEIGRNDDIAAIDDALRAGIKFIATVHGKDLADIKGRKTLYQLYSDKVFERYVVLDNSKGVGTIKEIIDAKTEENLLKDEDKLWYLQNLCFT